MNILLALVVVIGLVCAVTALLAALRAIWRMVIYG